MTSIVNREGSGNGARAAPLPFVKWAGGKRKLLEHMLPLLPHSFDRYVEPFVGGGALFFRLQVKEALLADANEELVVAFRAVRDDPDGLIERLNDYVYDEAAYYAVRATEPDERDLTGRAARTIFLNRAGYNGLYRTNAKGKFNVPFGFHRNPVICDAGNIRACSRALRGVEVECCDFAVSARSARAGDFVYFDPPYAPLSPSSFTSYTAKRFGDADQVRLRDVAIELKARGVQVLLSNADTPRVRELYADGFEIHAVTARRSISAKSDRRGPVGELLIR